MPSAVSFVYSWSRLSAIFTSFLVAGILKEFGHDRSVCVHRGSDANRHGGYRFHGSTHARSRAGKDFLWTAASHSFAATCLWFSTLKMSSLARWGRPYPGAG